MPTLPRYPISLHIKSRKHFSLFSSRICAREMEENRRCMTGTAPPQRHRGILVHIIIIVVGIGASLYAARTHNKNMVALVCVIMCHDEWMDRRTDTASHTQHPVQYKFVHIHALATRSPRDLFSLYIYIFRWRIKHLLNPIYRRRSATASYPK